MSGTHSPRLHEARFPDAERLAGRRADDCLRRHGAGARVPGPGCGTGPDAVHLRAPGRTPTRADLSEATSAPARARHLASRVRRTDGGAPPVARHSVRRPLFPQEPRRVPATHGFEAPGLRAGPGPRTEPPWRQSELPRTTAGGDRPHLVPRPHTTR